MRIPQKYHKRIILMFGIYFVISAVLGVYSTVIRLNGHMVKIPKEVLFESIISLEKCAKKNVEKYYDGKWKLVWITVGYNKIDDHVGKMRAYFYYNDDTSNVRHTCTVSMNSENYVMKIEKSSDLKKGSLEINLNEWNVDLDDIIEFNDCGFEWDYFSFGAYVNENNITPTIRIYFSGTNDAVSYYLNPIDRNMYRAY